MGIRECKADNRGNHLPKGGGFSIRTCLDRAKPAEYGSINFVAECQHRPRPLSRPGPSARVVFMRPTRPLAFLGKTETLVSVAGVTICGTMCLGYKGHNTGSSKQSALFGVYTWSCFYRTTGWSSSSANAPRPHSV